MALLILPSMAFAASCLETFNGTVITIQGDYDHNTSLSDKLSPNWQDCMDLAQLDYDTRFDNAVTDYGSCCCLTMICVC
ncbi:MAG: hypothetical protein ABIV51_12195 [Saprospiraceae bacterium]